MRRAVGKWGRAWGSSGICIAEAFTAPSRAQHHSSIPAAALGALQAQTCGTDLRVAAPPLKQVSQRTLASGALSWPPLHQAQLQRRCLHSCVASAWPTAQLLGPVSLPCSGTLTARTARCLTTSTAARSGAPIVAYPLAQTGEGISECELIQWFVQEGDVVKEFDKLCEVQSDKASVEISSRFDAKVLKMHYSKGDIVKVGATLVHLQVAEGTSLPPDMQALVVASLDAAPAAPTPASPAPPPPPSSVVPAAVSSPPTPPPSSLPQQHAPTVAAAAAAPPPPPPRQEEHEAAGDGAAAAVLTSPAVRRVAREAGVDLRHVPGTGPRGRITKEDVERYLATQQQPHAPATAATAAAVVSVSASVSSRPASPPAITTAAGPPPAPAPAPAAPGAVPADSVLPVRGYRRAMVKSMQAVAAVPHFHLHDEAVVDSLVVARKHLAHDPVLGGGKLTMLPFIIKAVSLTLADHPLLNSSLAADQASITLKGAHNLGVAMATPGGLVVPNIKQVQRLSVAQIAQELSRLQAAALAGKLSTEDVTGGTFTISNIGSIGGMFANPLVNPPEVAILAIGRVRQVAGVPAVSHHGKDQHHLHQHGGAPAAAAAAAAGGHLPHYLALGLSWGADHRVVDGAGLTHASNTLKTLLERPERMLLRTA